MLGPASQIRTGDIAVAARCTNWCETYYSRALYQAELRRVQLCNATLIFRPFDHKGVTHIRFSQRGVKRFK